MRMPVKLSGSFGLSKKFSRSFMLSTSVVS
jgi:hypothetical protein